MSVNPDLFDLTMSDKARPLLDAVKDHIQRNVIPIVEESAKLKIADYLVSKGAKVVIKDVPHMLDEVKKEYGNIFSYQSK